MGDKVTLPSKCVWLSINLTQVQKGNLQLSLMLIWGIFPENMPFKGQSYTLQELVAGETGLQSENMCWETQSKTEWASRSLREVYTDGAPGRIAHPRELVNHMEGKIPRLRVPLHYLALEVAHCDQAWIIRCEPMGVWILYLPELGITRSWPNHKEHMGTTIVNSEPCHSGPSTTGGPLACGCKGNQRPESF